MGFRAVAVLGSGPAGMAAAWAAAVRGHYVVVLSNTRAQSPIGGAQFLHRPLPNSEGDLPKPNFQIRYERWGNKSNYQGKIYGNQKIPFSSWERIQTHKPQDAWSLRETYDRLFELLVGGGVGINEGEINAEVLVEILSDPSFTHVISTIPKPNICTGECTFSSVEALMAHGQYHPIAKNTIIYNGDRDYSWARCSNIDGEEWTEWGADHPSIPVDEDALIRINKPVSNTCKCWDEVDKLSFAGRFGMWAKGKLVDDAFYDTLEVLK